MGLIFLGSWLAQSVTGWSVYNSEQIEHEEATVSWLGYVRSADFWEATLQNWQSECFAVGTMAIFRVYLRQRGSSQSKPVGLRTTPPRGAEGYSTVTVFARLRGWSTLRPRRRAIR
jgi:cephalosporin-C deacetylase-like acetyl esterase